MNTSTASKPAAPMVTCHKCDGAGRLAAFAHIENGACFTCGGSGKVRQRKVPAPKVRTPRPMDPAVVRARLENFYECAMEHGADWFADADVTGCGMPAVEALCCHLPAHEGAAVVVAFAAMRARRLPALAYWSRSFTRDMAVRGPNVIARMFAGQ